MDLSKKSLIIIFGAILFYIALILFSDVQELASNLQTIKIQFIPLILTVVFIAINIRSLRQYVLLKSVGIQIAYKKNTILYFLGLSMIITPGGSGELIKSYYLKKTFGINISKTFPVVLAERFYDFTGIILLLGVTLFFYFNIITGILFIFGITVISVVFVIVKKRGAWEFIQTKITKIKFLKKITKNLPESNESIIQLTSNKNTLKATGLSFLATAIEAFAVYLSFLAMDIEFNYFLSTQIVFSSGLIGLLTLLPGGLGVTESGIVTLLVSNGIVLSLASALVLLIRFSTLWFATIVGFISIKFYNKVN